jgi:hypothetical protein
VKQIKKHPRVLFSYLRFTALLAARATTLLVARHPFFLAIIISFYAIDGELRLSLGFLHDMP